MFYLIKNIKTRIELLKLLTRAKDDVQNGRDASDDMHRILEE